MGDEILTANIHLRVAAELRQLVEEEALQSPTDTFNDVVARILATHYKRKDLARVPRKRMGRPPNKTELQETQ